MDEKMFPFTTLEPWAAIVTDELRMKLDSPELSLSFASRRGPRNPRAGAQADGGVRR